MHLTIARQKDFVSTSKIKHERKIISVHWIWFECFSSSAESESFCAFCVPICRQVLGVGLEIRFLKLVFGPSTPTAERGVGLGCLLFTYSQPTVS